MASSQYSKKSNTEASRKEGLGRRRSHSDSASMERHEQSQRKSEDPAVTSAQLYIPVTDINGRRLSKSHEGPTAQQQSSYLRDAAEVQLRKLRGNVREAEKRAESAELRLKSVEDVCRTLRSDLRKRDEDFRAAEKQLMALNAQTQQKAQQADHKARQAEADAVAARAAYNKVQLEASIMISTLEEDKTSLSEKVKQSEEQVRELLDKLMQGKALGRWNPPPDSELRSRFGMLQTSMRDWSKTWAVKGIGKFPMETIKSLLTDFVALQSDGSLPRTLASPGFADRLPYLLLNAALAHEVQNSIFNNDFLCVGERAPQFDAVMGELSKSDRREASIWRASLWRLLCPPKVTNSSPESIIVRQNTNRRIQQYCDKIDSNFRRSASGVFLKHPSELSADAVEARGRELRQILLEAASLATILLVQYSRVTCLDLTVMQQRRLAFSIDSPLMQPHPLSKVDMDDPSHNGRRIMMVLRPALLAFEEDDTEGLSGDRYRVLAHAIVLLDEKKA